MSEAIPVSPDDVKEFTLTTHQQKPESTRTVFVIRTLKGKSFREVLRIVKKYTSPDANIEWEDLMDSVLKIIEKGICGWRNLQGLEYSPENVAELEEFLTFPELQQLAEAVINHNTVSVDTAKK